MFAHGQPDSLTTRDMGAYTPPEAQVYIHAMVMPPIIALVSNWGKGMTELGNTSLTKLLRDGAVEVTVDPKFPQAIGLESILQSVTTFGNFKWRILPNDSDDSLFFTSDFPAAIEKTDDLRILNRIVPLAPNLVLRIRPNLTLDRGLLDFSFTKFGYRSHNVGHEEHVKLNCLIVRCAKDTVFYRDDHPWVRLFVAKNRRYRIEPYTHRLTTPTGTLLVSTQRVVASTPPVEPTTASAG
jgi:hypothetical protein